MARPQKKYRYTDLRKTPRNKPILADVNAAVVDGLVKGFHEESIRDADRIIREKRIFGEAAITDAMGDVVGKLEFQDGVIKRYWLISRTGKVTIMQSIFNPDVDFTKNGKREGGTNG